MILIDWGTSNLRAVQRSPSGEFGAEYASAQGILNPGRLGFEQVLHGVIDHFSIATNATDPWTNAQNNSKNALLSGMVGSRNGWREVAYVQTPCGLGDLAHGLLAVGPQTHIVPGLAHWHEGTPDVMRGEEVQIFGAAHALGIENGCFVLPGTHSKWARFASGKITGFATHMTGEAYALLRTQSILAKLMAVQADDVLDERAFANAVALAQTPGGVLHHLFGTRSLALFDKLSATQAPSHLSGLLIGEEFRSACAQSRTDSITLVGSHQLVQAYAIAAQVLGIRTQTAPAHSTWVGLSLVAQAAGLIDQF